MSPTAAAPSFAVLAVLAVLGSAGSAGSAYAQDAGVDAPYVPHPVVVMHAGDVAPIDGRLVGNEEWVRLGQRMATAEEGSASSTASTVLWVAAGVVGGGLAAVGLTCATGHCR